MTAWELVRQGLGIGAMIDDVALLEALGPMRFPIWLVTHRELRTARRIRVVFDVLAEHLSAP